MTQRQSPSPAEIYEEFLVPGIHARWTPIFLDYAKPAPGENVLEVACGTGVVTRNTAPRVGNGGNVVAVDISPDMLQVARDLPPPDGAAIDWREGDASSLPDGPFDLVLCQQGFQFFPDCEVAAREMARVLRPGGRAVVSVWKDLRSHPLYEALIEAEARYLGASIEDIGAPFVFGPADKLRGILDRAGFAEVEIGEETGPAQFPSPERFITLTLLAGAAFIPETEMDAEARAKMVETISQQVEGTLQRYVEGDQVKFPMVANIAVAHV